jgi:hypothetical protein
MAKALSDDLVIKRTGKSWMQWFEIILEKGAWAPLTT